jgi:hypothetical protein
MSKRPPREHANRPAAPIVIAVLVGVVAGAGTTVVAAPLPGQEPRATAAETSANLRVTRGGKTWMSARASLVDPGRWAADVRTQFITPGRYRITAKFRGSGRDSVVRYKARITRAR